MRKIGKYSWLKVKARSPVLEHCIQTTQHPGQVFLSPPLLLESACSEIKTVILGCKVGLVASRTNHSWRIWVCTQHNLVPSRPRQESKCDAQREDSRYRVGPRASRFHSILDKRVKAWERGFTQQWTIKKVFKDKWYRRRFCATCHATNVSLEVTF